MPKCPCCGHSWKNEKSEDAKLKQDTLRATKAIEALRKFIDNPAAYQMKTCFEVLNPSVVAEAQVELARLSSALNSPEELKRIYRRNERR